MLLQSGPAGEICLAPPCTQLRQTRNASKLLVESRREEPNRFCRRDHFEVTQL